MGTATAPDSRRTSFMIPLLVAIVSTSGATAGCTPPTVDDPAPSSATTTSPALQCGSVQSAQHDTVPVDLVHGDVDCGQAIRIATQYFEAVAAFQGHNSGYALVDGWTCDSAFADSPVPDQPFWTCTTQGDAFTIGPPST